MTAVVDSTDGRPLPASRAAGTPAAALYAPRRLVVLSGLAGAGKTEVLRALGRQGEQILDLEALACHRGSAFGGVGQPPQPSHQEFHARVAAVWHAADPARPLFVEDEGDYLGRVGLPPPLVALMRDAGRVLVEAPVAARLSRLVRDYGSFPTPQLVAAVRRAAPRLGHSRSRAALAALARDDCEAAAEVLLPFYDVAYAHRLAIAGNVWCTVLQLGLDPTAATECVATCVGGTWPLPVSDGVRL